MTSTLIRFVIRWNDLGVLRRYRQALEGRQTQFHIDTVKDIANQSGNFSKTISADYSLETKHQHLALAEESSESCVARVNCD